MRVYTPLINIPNMTIAELHNKLYGCTLLPRQEAIVINELRYRNRLLKMRITQNE